MMFVCERDQISFAMVHDSFGCHAADAPDFDKFTKADDIPADDARQAIEETREAVESQTVAASPAGSLEDFPEALDDDDLPF